MVGRVSSGVGVGLIVSSCFGGSSLQWWVDGGLFCRSVLSLAMLCNNFRSMQLVL